MYIQYNVQKYGVKKETFEHCMQSANTTRRGIILDSTTTPSHQQTHVQCDVCHKTFRGFGSFGKHWCDSGPTLFDNHLRAAELEQQQLNLRERVSSVLLL